MTTFLDGPAKGKTLLLRRAVMFLRVVEKGGEFDALDMPQEEPFVGEMIHAYVVAEYRGTCHIHKRGGGRFYSMVDYRYVAAQPTQEVMASAKDWSRWCHDNVHLIPDRLRSNPI